MSLSGYTKCCYLVVPNTFLWLYFPDRFAHSSNQDKMSRADALEFVMYVPLKN